ncbi:hypothetical protein NC652_033045 [Populus alba x Populus x berolinensis]|nr:hypothetical protein NC652_033045 [Populus alba x Populus x berolinensis]
MADSHDVTQKPIQSVRQESRMVYHKTASSMSCDPWSVVIGLQGDQGIPGWYNHLSCPDKLQAVPHSPGIFELKEWDAQLGKMLYMGGWQTSHDSYQRFHIQVIYGLIISEFQHISPLAHRDKKVEPDLDLKPADKMRQLGLKRGQEIIRSEIAHLDKEDQD